MDSDRRTSATLPVRRSVASGMDALSAERCLELFKLMARTRALEERAIKMSKSGEATFWVGGPGEEAFNVCLGLLTNRGAGPAYDYLHLHYRNAGTLLAMGMPMIDHMRMMAMTATDRHSRGRYFVGHYSIPEWNVIPVNSVVGSQYVIGVGTAWMQRRHGGTGVSIVLGGDAGTAQGDFTSGMNWATRPDQELPILMAVTNNGYGISTAGAGQNGSIRICTRGEPFGIPGEFVDGNDVIAVWHAIQRALGYCRRERRPYLLEARVSRLNGHSSSSGAGREDATDCLYLFERKLYSAGVLHPELAELIHAEAVAEADEAARLVSLEPPPAPDDVGRFTYADSPVDAVYPGDYDGLPR